MKISKFFIFLLLSLALFFQNYENVNAGILEIPSTDGGQQEFVVSFLDLRNRETYIQITHNSNLEPAGDIDPSKDIVIHFQIYNVADNCSENNFFDTLTPNDTHVYNMRDIQTNDGNPSGVLLPNNSYGIVVISNNIIGGDRNGEIDTGNLIGNFRILDNSGYEYRSNLPGFPPGGGASLEGIITFNFNSLYGVNFSDFIGIVVQLCDDDKAICAAEITKIFLTFEIDIYNKNENAFSCRDVIFACVDEDNPRLEELLAIGVGGDTFGDPNASVASLEYGINNALPHSKGGELLCPGNNINEGFIRMTLKGGGNDDIEASYFFIGLNNGNDRGSMDLGWLNNR